MREIHFKRKDSRTTAHSRRLQPMAGINRAHGGGKCTSAVFRKRGRLLSSIFTSIQDGISILGKDYRIVLVNHTMERWYRHAMPLVGKKCYNAYHGRKRMCKICPSRRVFADGMPHSEVIPKVGRNRRVVGWIELYSFPFFDENTGSLQGVIEYVRDITER